MKNRKMQIASFGLFLSAQSLALTGNMCLDTKPGLIHALYQRNADMIAFEQLQYQITTEERQKRNSGFVQCIPDTGLQQPNCWSQSLINAHSFVNIDNWFALNPDRLEVKVSDLGSTNNQSLLLRTSDQRTKTLQLSGSELLDNPLPVFQQDVQVTDPHLYARGNGLMGPKSLIYEVKDSYIKLAPHQKPGCYHLILMASDSIKVEFEGVGVQEFSTKPLPTRAEMPLNTLTLERQVQNEPYIDSYQTLSKRMGIEQKLYPSQGVNSTPYMVNRYLCFENYDSLIDFKVKGVNVGGAFNSNGYNPTFLMFMGRVGDPLTESTKLAKYQEIDFFAKTGSLSTSRSKPAWNGSSYRWLGGYNNIAWLYDKFKANGLIQEMGPVCGENHGARSQRHLTYWIENTVHNDSVSGASVKYEMVKPANFVSDRTMVIQNTILNP